jgi:hypothetical protein
MSIFHRLKSQIRTQRETGAPPARYGGGDHEVVVLPEKPKKKRKLMEVQKEAKQTLQNLPTNSTDPLGGEDGAMDDDEEGEDDEEEKKKEPKKIPWGPPEILDHLNEPPLVENIQFVIENLKSSMKEDVPDRRGKGDWAHKDHKGNPVEIVWDHSQSKEGKKSDNNFFIWFETMAANEARKVMTKENMIFE